MVFDKVEDVINENGSSSSAELHSAERAAYEQLQWQWSMCVWCMIFPSNCRWESVKLFYDDIKRGVPVVGCSGQSCSSRWPRRVVKLKT